MLLMIHSLFDVRVDMIGANFALWNVIEQNWDKLGLIMYLVILHKFFVYIDVCFCANWWIVYFCDISMTAYTAHLGG